MNSCDQGDLSLLINELAHRMQDDVERLKRWRYFHRCLGILFTITTIALPSVMAVGLVSYSNTTLSKTMLLIITVVSGLNAAFQPNLHSQQRRFDMNGVRALFDSYRFALAESGADVNRLTHVYREYSEKFSYLYEMRGHKLVDANLAEKEKHRSSAAQPGVSITDPLTRKGVDENKGSREL